MKIQLLVLSFIVLSCGDINIKDNKVKADLNESNDDVNESKTTYEYEREYEKVKITTNGGEIPEHLLKDCLDQPTMGYMYPEPHDLNTLINTDDNVYIRPGTCKEVSCPEGYAIPQYHILDMIQTWGMISMGQDDSIWWQIKAQIYLPASNTPGAGDHEQAKTDGHRSTLICLKESAFQHLYTGD